MTHDTSVSIHPYFKVSEGNLDKVRPLLEQCVAITSQEPKCQYYGFSLNGHEVFCREAYEGAEGLIEHLASIGPTLRQLLDLAEIARLEVHGVETELAKLRGPLAALNPTYYVLEYGFHR
ncbi:MAG: hypothetical protein IPM24_27100 [Bryobacterales bacterium]|nr:hypothetical protein [Bryobacterales bacterium]